MLVLFNEADTVQDASAFGQNPTSVELANIRICPTYLEKFIEKRYAITHGSHGATQVQEIVRQRVG